MLGDPYAALEFDKVIGLLRRHASSPLGMAKLDGVLESRRLPSADMAERALATVAEAVDWLADADCADQQGVTPVPSFGGVSDIREPLGRLALEGAVLDAPEIRALLQLLDASQRIRGALLEDSDRRPLLRARGAELPDFRQVLAALSGKVLPNDEISSLASTALSRVRRRIERQRQEVEESLERFVRKHAQSGVLQDQYVTMRNGRTVVPVKAAWKNRVDGIVHGASSTGQTVFVEPLDTIVQNNRLVRLREDEQAEILRILREMTERLRSERERIAIAAEAVGELDYVFARARFWRDFQCCKPRFGSGAEARIVLDEARHPLLQDLLSGVNREPVPLSLQLGGGLRTLVVSGPNAGGKTVVLKTIGVLAAMAQAGIPVPAAEAEFPWFEGILADIGDAQSISESQSTFSAHVSKLSAIIAAAGAGTLAILDELGTATDPEDGGALAVAAVERLQSTGGFAMVSTHLPDLKIYSARAQGVVSAAMGFDDATQGVTYRLQCGIPGQSAGLEMAERFGMPADVIRRARELRGQAGQEASEFLSDLRQRVGEYDELSREARRKMRELGARERDLERQAADRAEELRMESAERIERLTRKLERKFRDSLDAALNKIRSAASKVDRKTERRVAQSLGSYRRAVSEEVRAALGEDADRTGASGASFAPGDLVRLRSMGATGEIVRELDGGRWEVQAGAMRLQASAEDLVAAEEGEERPVRLPAGVRLETAPDVATLPAEINVIGMTADEALLDVDRFLDRAVLANKTRLRVVHGFGKDVLRRELWHMFARHVHVSKYYQAEQHEGGAGATIVEVGDS